MYYHTCTWPLWTGIAIWLAILSPVSAQDFSPLKKRLLQEAPQAWKNYEEFSRTLQGGSLAERIELTGKDKNKVSRRIVAHWKQCKGHRLTQQEIFDRGEYRAAVAVYNPQYKFSLTRSNDQKPWVVRELVKRSPDANLPEEEPPPGLVFGEPIRFLPLLFNSPDFKIIDVTSERRNGEEMVRMTFSCTKDPFKGPPRSGWLILDPNHDWVIRDGEIEIAWDDHTQIKQTFDTEYKEGSDHHPITTKCSLKSTVTKNGQITHEHELRGTVDVHEQKWVPDSEFTLSAFGFPEPPWLRPKKTPWYLWAALAGIVCLVGAATLRWVKRRTLRVSQASGS